MQVSINELLVQLKMARHRIGELTNLRNVNSMDKTTTYFGGGNSNDKEVKEICKYDPVEVDKYISKLNRFIYKADAAIKASNAVTLLNVDQDIDELLQPIKPLG